MLSGFLIATKGGEIEFQYTSPDTSLSTLVTATNSLISENIISTLEYRPSLGVRAVWKMSNGKLFISFYPPEIESILDGLVEAVVSAYPICRDEFLQILESETRIATSSVKPRNKGLKYTFLSNFQGTNGSQSWIIVMVQCRPLQLLPLLLSGINAKTVISVYLQVFKLIHNLQVCFCKSLHV